MWFFSGGATQIPTRPKYLTRDPPGGLFQAGHQFGVRVSGIFAVTRGAGSPDFTLFVRHLCATPFDPQRPCIYEQIQSCLGTNKRRPGLSQILAVFPFSRNYSICVPFLDFCATRSRLIDVHLFAFRTMKAERHYCKMAVVTRRRDAAWLHPHASVGSLLVLPPLGPCPGSGGRRLPEKPSH